MVVTLLERRLCNWLTCMPKMSSSLNEFTGIFLDINGQRCVTFLLKMVLVGRMRLVEMWKMRVIGTG